MAKRKSKGRRPQAQHRAKSKRSQHDKRKRLARRNDQRRQTTEANVPLHGTLATFASSISGMLDARNRFRLPIVIAGMMLALGSRTAASWFRAAGVFALPLLSLLYVRKVDVAKLQERYGWEFHTKLEIALDLIQNVIRTLRALGSRSPTFVVV